MAFSQTIPPNFRFLTKIDRPADLKWGIPSEVLVDSTSNFLIIAYDYNPTYLDFYSLDNWNLLKRVEVKGHVYMDNSYFHTNDNSVYIDRGQDKNKYLRINLDTYIQSKVKCEKVPRGCPYKHVKESIYEDYNGGSGTLINNGSYIITYDDT